MTVGFLSFGAKTPTDPSSVVVHFDPLKAYIFIKLPNLSFAKPMFNGRCQTIK